MQLELGKFYKHCNGEGTVYKIDKIENGAYCFVWSDRNDILQTYWERCTQAFMDMHFEVQENGDPMPPAVKKFVVGQKIKQLEGNGFNHTVVSVDEDGWIKTDLIAVWVPPSGFVEDIVMIPVVQQQVAPREFQVGDRVRCSESDEWSRQGWEGTVTTTQGGGELNTRVKWDEGFHFWIRQKNLELMVEEEPKAAEETYIYLAVMKKRDGGIHCLCHHLEPTINSMIACAERIEGGGMKIVSKKRIKITL